MKALFVAFWLLISVSSAKAIPVTGVGRNFEEAKQNAFITAIEYAVGAVVVSERESVNYKLTKNEILVYSAGYIENYKIISQTYDGRFVHLTLDVNVNSNKLSDRILGKHSSKHIIDSDAIQTQVNTHLHEKRQADKLLEVVLKDYPYRAFNIEQFPHYISTSSYRDVELVMPYKLSWNYNYVKALAAVAEQIQDATPKFLSRNPATLQIAIKSPDSLIFGEKMQFEFNDLTFTKRIASNFYDSELRVMARILDKSNQTVWYICHHPGFLSGRKTAFYGSGNHREVLIFGNTTEKGEVRLSIGPDLNRILKQAYQIQLEIVKYKDC